MKKKHQNTYLQEGKKVEKQGDSAQVPVWETNLVFSSHPRHQERLRSNPVRSSKAKSKSPRIHTIVPYKAETRRSNLGNASVWLFRPLTETRRGEACLGMSRPPWRRHYEAAEAESKADAWWGEEGNAPEHGDSRCYEEWGVFIQGGGWMKLITGCRAS